MDKGFEVFKKLLFRAFTDAHVEGKFKNNTNMTITHDETLNVIVVELTSGERHSRIEVPVSDLRYDELFDMSRMWIVALCTVERLTKGIEWIEDIDNVQLEKKEG